MKNKLIKVFLAFVIALPMFTSVFAISSEDLLARLESIKDDINDVKAEYEEIIDAYPEVIDSLSSKSKETVEDLRNGLVLEEGIASRVESLKAELSASTVPEAAELLEATEGVEKAFNDMIKDNKDIVQDVKANISKLSTKEIQQIVEKTVEIIETLGAETNVSDTYKTMMDILDEAHKMAKNINTKLESVIANNVSTFKSALTKELVVELLKEVKAKDRDAVIDTLTEALNNANGGAALKQDLKELKTLAVKLKNKLMELDTLSEQDLLMFTAAQKKDVSNKIKLVEKDYVDFAKVVLDGYSEDYMDVVIDLAYDESVDQMIGYANKALDYYKKYEDTIDSLSVSMFVDKVPEEIKALGKKAGLMVALGFVDVSEYNRSYVSKNFQTQIDNMAEYIAQEVLDYLDFIKLTIKNEVDTTYSNSKDQNELRSITTARFNTISNLEALKKRVDKELLANREGAKAKLAELASYVYDIYNNNIFYSIEATLMKEEEEEKPRYEVNMNGYILTNEFIPTSEFTKEIGIPAAKKGVATYESVVNSKIKTGSSIVIELSDESTGMLMFAVLGDIYADGLIDARDYMVIKNYIMDGEEVSEMSLAAADTYRDELVDSRDYMVIKNYIMDGTEISL